MSSQTILAPTLAFVLALVVPNVAFPEVAWRHLSDRVIRAALTGKEFTDGKRFTHRYMPHGKLRGLELAGKVEGQWRIERDEHCTVRMKPRPSDECFEVQQRNGELRLMQDGYVTFHDKVKDLSERSRRELR